MKKVLVLAAAMALLATPALAAIQGSAHDLSTLGAATYATGTDEVCVFCHTPHGGLITANAPLWNRGAVDATAVYSNASLTAAAAAVTIGVVNATDAPLCLSCHDGASVGTALINPPNAGTMNYVPLAGAVAGAASLGTDLSNDHPIGFDYAAAQGADAGLHLIGDAQTVLGADAFAFGAGGDMWCSSCHDVHGVVGVSTFLRVANTGSALCLACHIK